MIDPPTEVVVVETVEERIVVEEADGSSTVVSVTDDSAVSVVSLLVPGPPGSVGPAGPAGPTGLSGGTYVHTQAVPAAVWVIDHPLGYPPAVTVIDTLGDVVWGDVSYPIPISRVQLAFSAEFSGTAYLS